MCRKAAERRSLRLFCGKNRHFGPSDWFRTSGLVVPNHALYHLSYTRIFDFLVLPLWSKMWSNGVFGELCGSHEVPKLQCFQGFRGFRISLERRGCYTLPNHPRYQLRHTRLYYFILYYCTYWLSAFNPRRFPQKHSRATRDPEKACLFGKRTRGVMNEFSPKAETNDMEQPRTMERSLRSLFLHLGAMPSSATGGGIPPRPTAPHPVVLCFLVCFLLIDFLLSIRALPSET